MCARNLPQSGTLPRAFQLFFFVQWKGVKHQVTYLSSSAFPAYLAVFANEGWGQGYQPARSHLSCVCSCSLSTKQISQLLSRAMQLSPGPTQSIALYMLYKNLGLSESSQFMAMSY